MLKALIGMLKWKIRMNKLDKKQPYTDEWWTEVEDALEFLPKDQRKGFVDTYVGLMISF